MKNSETDKYFKWAQLGLMRKNNFFMKTNNNRNFSTLISKFNTGNWELKELNPLFVTGFVDAEGSFMIIIKKSKTNKIG